MSWVLCSVLAFFVGGAAADVGTGNANGKVVGALDNAFSATRAYDPRFGRWLSPDPIGFAGGNRADASPPASDAAASPRIVVPGLEEPLVAASATTAQEDRDLDHALSVFDALGKAHLAGHAPHRDDRGVDLNDLCGCGWPCATWLARRTC